MTGDVLDVGGKKANLRGEFRPPDAGVTSWITLNSHISAVPDALGDAHHLPFFPESFDCVLICEVLEHLANPGGALEEIHQVLREGGVTLITIPFLVGVHSDPYDYQRWTSTKLKGELESVGFSQVEISPMGGIWGVTADLLRLLTENHSDKIGTPTRTLGRIIVQVMQYLSGVDQRISASSMVVTTGWAVIARK